MRDIYEYASVCMELLDDLGIEYGRVIRFDINTRAKKRWGQCKIEKYGYSININADLLDEENDSDGLTETIIHELLHTIPGCMNHGKKWKSMAEKVNQAYGLNIARCSSAEDKGVTKRDINKVEYKYILQCDSCGNTYGRIRMSNAVKFPKAYRCGCCGGELKRIK